MPHHTRNDSVEINYQVQGEGPDTYLLFNGASLTIAFWGSLATRLAESGRVIRFDQRNAGETRFVGDFTLNDVAADVASLLAALECEKVIAIGHAWGGRAAQVFARDYPHLVKALVICANGGQFPPRDTKQIDQRLREARVAGDRDAWERAYEARWCGAGFAARDPDRFREVADLGWNGTARRDARWNSSVSPSASYWGTATVPCLLIYGEEDKNGTPENAEDLLRRLPDAELLMLPGAGHFVIREQEDRVLDAITQFASKTTHS